MMVASNWNMCSCLGWRCSLCGSPCRRTWPRNWPAWSYLPRRPRRRWRSRCPWSPEVIEGVFELLCKTNTYYRTDGWQKYSWSSNFQENISPNWKSVRWQRHSVLSCLGVSHIIHLSYALSCKIGVLNKLKNGFNIRMCLRITYAAVSVLHPDADGVVEVGEVVGVVGGAHVGLVVPALDLARGTGVVLQAPDGGQVPAQSCCKITDKRSQSIFWSSLDLSWHSLESNLFFSWSWCFL